MKRLMMILALVFVADAARAAVGCDLNDPDRDVKRLFPGSTGFKTKYLQIDRLGGKPLLADIERRLGDSFSGLFETIDVPYTLYEIYQGTKLIGYIHGVNQKGEYGGLQVFLAVDTNGVIRNFYYQKLTSKGAKALRSPTFARQFAGLTPDDFARYDVKTGASTGRVSGITNPAAEAAGDFRSTLRAVKKNLILIDQFVLGNRYRK